MKTQIDLRIHTVRSKGTLWVAKASSGRKRKFRVFFAGHTRNLVRNACPTIICDLFFTSFCRDGERGLFFPPHRKRLLTKDTTGALKMWLRRHKKNPYPSKAEKIMLAILSKMTLTQVSTWFANARRRLKKDYPDDDDMGPQQDNTTICSDSSPYFSCND